MVEVIIADKEFIASISAQVREGKVAFLPDQIGRRHVFGRSEGRLVVFAGDKWWDVESGEWWDGKAWKGNSP